MPLLPNVQFTALQAQHSLQSNDLIRICHLAKVEGIFKSIESWNFEQFFGFTLHLFITTESPHTRQQLSQLLPKFGSRVVLPLIKIAHHFPAGTHEPIHDVRTDVRTLALQSLSHMAPPSFIIGLREVLELECVDELMPILLAALVKLTHQQNDETILLLLAQLLPKESWKLVEGPFRQKLSQQSFNVRLDDEESPLKIKVVTDTSSVNQNYPASQSANQPTTKTSLEIPILSSCS